MAWTRNRHLILALILCILFASIWMVTARKTISAEEAVQIALNESAFRNLTDEHPFSLGEAQLERPWPYNPDVTPPAEVWVVPVSVCYDTDELWYRVEITREGTLYGIPRPSHPAYPPPEDLDNRSCAFWAPTKSDPLTTSSREAVAQIVLRHSGVIRWIGNNPYEVQDVQPEAAAISTNPTFTRQFWTVMIMMKNNQSVNHGRFRVLMNGTVQNIGFPTSIPLE